MINSHVSNWQTIHIFTFKLKFIDLVMQHRQVAMHRMLLDETKNEISPARTNGCVQIVKSEIASSSEDGATLNYRR